MASRSLLRAAQSFALKIVEDPVYQKDVYDRALLGTLHPTLEKALWEMAWGKVPDRLEITDHEVDLSDLSDGELHALLGQLQTQLLERGDSPSGASH